MLKDAGFKLGGATLFKTTLAKCHLKETLSVNRENKYKSVEFSIVESAILREAKILIPKFEQMTRKTIAIVGKSIVTINMAGNPSKIKITDIIEKNGEHILQVESYLDASDKSEDKNNVKTSIEAFKNLIKEARDKTKAQFDQQVTLDDAEENERYDQYIDACFKLKNYISDFLDSTPALEKTKQMKFNIINHDINWDALSENEQAEQARLKRWKPNYDKEKNELTLHTVHIMGKFHVNSEIEVHETGAIIVYLSLSEFVDFGFYNHRGQVYFLLQPEGRFITRNAKRVKELGTRDKWRVSIFTGFGTKDIDKAFLFCYVCGSKLHYPAIPEKVNGSWVHLLKPCCSCFVKITKNPELIQKAIETIIEREKMAKQPGHLRKLLGIDEENEENNDHY